MADFKNSHLLTEDVIAIREISKHTPTRPSYATIYRWVSKGVTRSDGVKIRIESIKIGQQLLTSVQAVHRFIAASQTEEVA